MGWVDDIWPRLIQQESGGNPYAVSPVGAFGKAQLMPATSRDPGFGIQPFNPSVPGDNERMGKDYLTAMFARYGDPKKALVAYNWGPGNADKWGGDMNRLPAETRNYVNTIMGGKDMPINVRASVGNGLLPQQAGGGLDLASLLPQQQGNNLGQLLLALGAGIASGGAPGGGGWGGGIGRGLAGASAALQNNQEMSQRQQAYALQLAQLQNQMNYQNANLAQGAESNQLNRDIRIDALTERKDKRAQEEIQQESDLTSPLNIITSQGSQYPNAKNVLTTPRGIGSWSHAYTTGGGEVGRALNVVRSALTGAALIKKVDAKALYDAYLPTGPEDAKEKLAAFEDYMKGIQGGLGAAYPSQAETLKSLDAFSTPAEAAPAGGGAPLQAGMAGKGGPGHKDGATTVKDGVTYVRRGGKWYKQ